MKKILWGERAVLLNKKTLVIGDLHIGIEQSMKGVNLPSNTEKMLERIKKLKESVEPKEIVIIGDLKHKIASVSAQEKKEIPRFLKKASESVDLKIVLGNHDGGLKKYLKNFEVHPSAGFKHGKYYLMHGNAKPKGLENEEVIASHWHPIQRFGTGFGTKLTEPIWVEAELTEELGGNKILILPTFNKLLGGIELKKISTQWINLEGAKKYLTDGTYIGKEEKNAETSNNSKNRP